MDNPNGSKRYCIIGAGAAGLAVAKNFQQRGIPFDVFDRHEDVGGLWGFKRPYSAVYESARLISSKPMTQFQDFPMPADLPDYPGQRAVLDYFKSYAEHFDLRRHIRFNTEITQTTRNGEDWEVELADGSKRQYGGLVVASGITWDPNYPDIPGEFSGKTLHSVEYKTAQQLSGKKVLVIGGGNSGCDIAAEVGRQAKSTFLSVRRGYHFIPRYVFGIPTDQFGEFSIKMGTPLWARQWLNQMIVKLVLGNPVKLGFPKPEHRILESHPIVNAEVLEDIRQGRVVAKSDVSGFDGCKVLFNDHSQEEIDVVIFATGYKLSFPYLHSSHLNGPEGAPNFYLHIFHPEYNNLFITGMIQPDSGVWRLMDDQAALISAYIGAQRDNHEVADRFNILKSGSQPNLSGGIRYVNSVRHHTEVEHSSYRRILAEHLVKLRPS